MGTYKSIVVLTGAGISAESGIKTFRAADGLWENHHVEDVASPEGFVRDPELVHKFYNERRRQLLSSAIRPNAAHSALAKLEREHGNVLVITQNIDDLHERSGSKQVIHMHGELLKVRCVQSGEIIDSRSDVTIDNHCHCCPVPGALRPHVVWFGEMPLEMDRIFHALGSCDLFVAIGTSGNVYPAAGFVQEALRVGAHTVELNLEPSKNNSIFAETHYGPATKVVPEFVESVLNGDL